MHSVPFKRSAFSLALSSLFFAGLAQAQQVEEAAGEAFELPSLTVSTSADASAEGLPQAYAGGQVAAGSRVGILGNQDYMDTPFTTTSYTQTLIQDQQAASIGEVLLNDPAVRVARGFGNFQQVYMVRGLPIFSDDIAYNGLYGLLPRQYMGTEFVERVEVLARRPQSVAPLVELGDRVGVRVRPGPLDDPDGDVPLTVATLPGDAVVDAASAARLAATGGTLFDAVYGQWPTALARAWQDADLPAHSGLGMLLHQAVRQVRIFRDGDPEAVLPDEPVVVAAMRRAVVGD